LDEFNYVVIYEVYRNIMKYFVDIRVLDSIDEL